MTAKDDEIRRAEFELIIEELKKRDQYPSTLADGAGYVFRYNPTSTSWTNYHPRLYQIDLQAKTIKRAKDGQLVRMARLFV